MKTLIIVALVLFTAAAAAIFDIPPWIFYPIFSGCLMGGFLLGYWAGRDHFLSRS